MDTFYSSFEPKFWDFPSMDDLPRLEPNYPVKIKLQVEAFVVPRKENKEEKDNLEGKKI